VAEAVLQILMEADVDGLVGAGRYERNAERATWRRYQACGKSLSVAAWGGRRTAATIGAPFEAAIGRYKRVIGDSLRSRTHRRQVTEAAVATNALNRMLEFGRPKSVRIA
jgi:hypothetical protein